MQAMAAFDKGVLGYMMRKRLEAALAIHAAVIYRASSVRLQALLLWRVGPVDRTEESGRADA